MAVADLKKMHNVQFFLHNVCNMSGLFFLEEKEQPPIGRTGRSLASLQKPFEPLPVYRDFSSPC